MCSCRIYYVTTTFQLIVTSVVRPAYRKSYDTHTFLFAAREIGMFLIQSSPLPSMSCMKEYAQWLLHQYIRPHFKAGVEEVHVVFDTPGSMPETPKELEKRRRDKEVTRKLLMHMSVMRYIVLEESLLNGEPY